MRGLEIFEKDSGTIDNSLRSISDLECCASIFMSRRDKKNNTKDELKDVVNNESHSK